MKLDSIYPYLMPGLISADWEPVSVNLGHGIYATLFEDNEGEKGIVHKTVSPDDIASSEYTAAQLHDRALDNLVRSVQNGDVAIQMAGKPGGEFNFLLFTQHPRACACLRLPNLYQLAFEYLQVVEICACVPQRESLVVMPARTAEYRQSMVRKLREIEADARRPISFELFNVTESGISPRQGE